MSFEQHLVCAPSLASDVPLTPQPVRPEVVSLNNVSTELPDGRPMLQDVSFSIQEGDFAWIKGESGSGKSTIHRIVGNIEEPTEGEVMLFGQDISKLRRRPLEKLFAAKVGLGVQRPSLKGNWSTEDNMTHYSQMMGQPERESVVLTGQILNRLGLIHKADQLASTLSGGEQQLVALGSLLVTRPRLLLLDEPTSAMDSNLKERTFQMLRDLTEGGMTVMMISHDNQAADYVTRMIEVSEGKIVGQSSAQSESHFSGVLT